MTRTLALFIASLVVILLAADPSRAASLRVAPVLLDLTAPSAATTLRVWNDAKRPINVQVRVFRWTQRNGEDAFAATDAVVASPPITTLVPGGENLIRIVRTSGRPVQAEESYRLVVDELPDPARRPGGTVVLVVRHSIPVFFADPDASAAAASWAVERRGGGYVVTVRNTGAKRLRISNLTLGGSQPVARRGGLVGYVLGNSTARWFVPATGRGRLTGRSVTITAYGEAGRFDATARLKGG